MNDDNIRNRIIVTELFSGLHKIINDGENENEVCHICDRCYDELWEVYSESYINTDNEEPDVNVSLLSYKLSKPICVTCYYNIIVDDDFVNEILKSNPNSVWAKNE